MKIPSFGFDANGDLFRLVSEALRIRLAYLFDPYLAVHTANIQPLPHQISAVYEKMLELQPLRFLLADDPGSGKTIMAGLLIRELMLRGDVERCLVVCPGNLVNQWQDELSERFNLSFEILTRDKLKTIGSGNWFLMTNLAIARLDMLARDESIQDLLTDDECRYDLIICDEAHKMSATIFGGRARYTRRHELGQLLSKITRHFVLLTATPHNGKEEDFQLFLALLDPDRFAGRFRAGVHEANTSDLMRRMVKEKLRKFDGRPLFPERRTHSVPYQLTTAEMILYDEVTNYVREGFNQAATLQNRQRRSTVGFALTILQRRLASSPEAIWKSLKRRRKRLSEHLRELQSRNTTAPFSVLTQWLFSADDLNDLEDTPAVEMEEVEQEVVKQATAAQTISELQIEVQTLQRLENLALHVRNSGEDTKWMELAHLLDVLISGVSTEEGCESDFSSGIHIGRAAVQDRKLVVFTEHRDTLMYLEQRIENRLGSAGTVVTIHGGLQHQKRLSVQERFWYESQVRVLLATDAAGEGINLQRANLMVNYDLPWNPNRIEQRFGRIHRIGQTEVCHLWNLVADHTIEGSIWRTLFDKLERARSSLGGQVFDVLGKVEFEGKPLRDLMIEAVRYGDRLGIRTQHNQIVSEAINLPKFRTLIEDKALAPELLDLKRVEHVREKMELAESHRLQPYYIEAFFLEAFRCSGGNIYQRESRRYEITQVPIALRQLFGSDVRRYERVVFEKERLKVSTYPDAVLLCPGQPLLDAVVEDTLDKHALLLRQGAVLVDDQDMGTRSRLLVYLEHSIGNEYNKNTPRVASRRMLYVEIDQDGNVRLLQYAPYLDYRPLSSKEPQVKQIMKENSWVGPVLESNALNRAAALFVPQHLAEVRDRRLKQIATTRNAIYDRLTKEIYYWDRRAMELKEDERKGKVGIRLNAQEASRQAGELHARLQNRMTTLDAEKNLHSQPPVVRGAALIVPVGSFRAMAEDHQSSVHDTQASAARAREIVMKIERKLGFKPIDREFDKLGYDIESRDPNTGNLRLIEVKGRVSGATTITVTKNEILTSLNQPDAYILAIVELFDDGKTKAHYLRKPFKTEPDFGAASVNYNLPQLLARATAPH